MAHQENEAPNIILPQTTTSVMSFSEIAGNANISNILDEISKYMTAHTITHCKKKYSESESTENKSESTENKSESTENKSESVENESKKNLNDHSGLPHPDRLAGMQFKFNSIPTIGNSTLLKEIYEHGSFIVYKNYTQNEKYKIAFVFPPQKIKTFAKATRSQFYKTIIGYFEFIIESLTFSKCYRYPYKEVFKSNDSNDIILNMSILFAYSKEDYPLFNTKKSYEQYLYESFKLKPSFIFHVNKQYSSRYRYDNYNPYGIHQFHESLVYALKRALNTEYFDSIDILSKFRNIAINESKIIKKEREYYMEHSIYIHDKGSNMIQMDQFSKKIL